jgi:hypothetical protein
MGASIEGGDHTGGGDVILVGEPRELLPRLIAEVKRARGIR